MALRDLLTDPARRVTEAEWLSANRDALTAEQVAEQQRIACQALGTQMNTVLYGDPARGEVPPRQFSFLTVPGQAVYDVPPHETPIRRIDECWIERSWDGFRFLLANVGNCRLRDRYAEPGAVLGLPTNFMFDGAVLSLSMAPDAEYRVGMIERNEQRMHPEIPRSELYNELAAVTRCALRPRHYFGPDFGPNDFRDAYLDRDGAREKSLNLMKEWLAPRQLEQYEAEGCFDVKGSNGGRYRISNAGTTFNVRELRRTVLGNLLPGDKLCFQPAGVYSQGDVMLAQKIMLERDEPGALKIANRSHT